MHTSGYDQCFFPPLTASVITQFKIIQFNLSEEKNQGFSKLYFFGLWSTVCGFRVVLFLLQWYICTYISVTDKVDLPSSDTFWIWNCIIIGLGKCANSLRGHSHIMLWCFFPFLTPPSPHVILCYVFSNPPFTITWFLDNPPPLANLLILVSWWSCNILFFFISLYQNIYYPGFQHICEKNLSK